MSVEVKREINVPLDYLLENISINIRRHLPQFQPHAENDNPCAIICGGPSLVDCVEEIKDRHDGGLKVVSTNATHDYLLNHGIRPSAHIQLDARPFNFRFVENWHYKTTYFIASQSHPSVFDALDGADVRIFHCVAKPSERAILRRYYFGHYFEVPGGSTVGLRAIILMRMLGYSKIEMYGFDSCYLDGIHHAYDQDENSVDPIGTVTVGGREFKCAPWMHSQAIDFCEVIKHVDDKLRLVVHGDGLIAHILKTGATLSKEEN